MFRLIWVGMMSIAAEAISTRQKSEVQRIDLNGLRILKTDVDHRLEGDTDPGAHVVHQLDNLIEISRIIAEVAGEDTDRSRR